MASQANVGDLDGPASISNLPLNDFSLVIGESRFQVVWQCCWMVKRASVQPEPLRLVAPRFVDDPLQEPLAQALTDEFARQTELHQLNVGRLPAIQFGEPCGHAVNVQHV